MKNKLTVIGIIIFAVLFLLNTAVTASGSTYRYTGTSFRYIGDIFHEKEIMFFGGDIFFIITGIGLVEGTHEVHTKKNDNSKMTNIQFKISGSTSINNAANLISMEKALIDHLEQQRRQAIAAVDNYIKNVADADPEEYTGEFAKINAYYDDLIREVKSNYADAKKNVRILSSIEIEKPRALFNVGIEMNPGERGYISQSIGHRVDDGGEYLRAVTRTYNTGGKTAKETRVSNFMKEKMTVEGYAQIWESTEVSKGKTKGSGWWFTMP